MLTVFCENITNEDVDLLPLLKFEGPIVVVENESEITQACSILKTATILGFDTETKPTFKKGQINSVSMVQLSTLDVSYIFRINKTGLHNDLISILASESIKKIGVAIRDDINQLARIKRFQPQGFIDLQSTVSKYGIAEKGLKKIAAIVLGGRISKSQRTSNWENEHLSPPQLIYAATDSWACLKIYEHLNRTI